eukprot:4684554-Pleurochrysis_carterae.AAC.1
MEATLLVPARITPLACHLDDAAPALHVPSATVSSASKSLPARSSVGPPRSNHLYRPTAFKVLVATLVVRQ